MNKFFVAIALLLAFISVANAGFHFEAPAEETKDEETKEEEKDAEYSVAGDKFTYSHHSTGEGHKMVKFALDRKQNLGSLDAATTICFQTDENHNIGVGAKGFGMQFSCNAGVECEHNYQVASYFFASEVTDVEGDMVMWDEYNPRDPDNMSRNFPAANKGLYNEEPQDGTKLVSYYDFSEHDFTTTHLPDGSEGHLSCFYNWNNGFYDQMLNSKLTLGGEGSDWKRVDLAINHTDTVEEENDEGDN